MANVTIDKVQVDVEASAKGVSQVFTQLEKQMTTLKNALGNINTKNLSKIANINTSGMSKAEKDISASVNGIKQSLAGLESLKNSALGGDTSSLTSFNRRVVAIQGAIDVLREKMAQVGATTVESSQFTILKNQSDELGNKLQELKAKMSDATSGKVTLSTSEFAALTDEIKDTDAALTDVQNKMNEMTLNGTAYVNADTLTAELQGAKSEVDNFVNTTNNSKPQLDTSGITDALSNIASQASETTSRLLNLVGRGIISGISSVTSGFSKMRNAISNLGKASSYTSSLFGKILRYGFGIRSLYVLFRRLRQAVKDSFTELQNSGAEFQTTRANIEALKNSLTTLKYQFGAAFEPIFNTIAPALQTLINYLISAMNTLSAFIAKITGRSTYSKVAAVTTKVASGAGSAAKAVGELNKQLQGFDELNNLDLDSGSGGSGGGGGSSSGGDVTYEEASVESALGNFANSLADMIKAGNWEGVGSAISDKISNALDGIDWTTIRQKATKFGTNLANFFNGFITPDLFSSVGTTLAQSLNTLNDTTFSFATTFDWINLGTSLGEGINSFFLEGEFDKYGENVRTWISGILDAGISLLTTTEFQEIGTKLAEFMNGLTSGEIGAKIKTFCSNLITAIGDVITGFKNTASEKTKLITAIGSILGVLAITKSVPLTITFAVAIAGFKIGEMYYESATGETVNQSFIDELGDIAEGMFGDNKIEFDLADAITFVWKDLGGQNNSELNFWQRLLYGTLSSMFAPAMVTAQYGKIIIDLKDLIELKWSNLSGKDQKTLSAWSPVQYFLKPALDSMFSVASLKKTIHNVIDLANLIEIKWDMSKTKEKLKTMGENIPKGIKEGIKTYLATNPFVSLATTLWDKIVKPICTKFGIESPAKKMYEYGKNIFLGIVEGFKDAMTSYGWLGLLGDLYDYFNGNKTTTTKTGYSAKENFNNDAFRNKINVNINTKMTGQAKSKNDVDNLKTSFSNLNTEASKGANATYNANVGGKIAEITDLDTWKQKFTSLYEKWQSKSATMRASVGGQMESIDDTYTWIDKITNLATKWTNSKSTTSMNVTSDVGNLDGSGGYLERLTKAANTWKNTKPTATFTTNLDGTLKSASEIDTVAKSFQTLGSNYDKVKGSHTSSWSISFGGASVESIKSYADAAYKLYKSFYEDDHTATWTMTLSGSTSGVQDFINNFVAKLNEKMKSVTFRANFGALGGVITHGMMKHIPQYAGGTLNAGSVFVAGEAGPEVMGHINGRTEILNRSQIGSIIHSSFVSAMSQFGNRMLATPESISYNSGSYSGYSGTNSDGNAENKYLLAEQNALLREQNELLAQILEKPTGISSREAFNAVRGEANNYYRRTGNGAFLS